MQEEHKAEIVDLIEEDHYNGARYHQVCQQVGVSDRTLQRWKRGNLKD
ncbi:hypothetical protein CMK14_10675 [Candidatus Poribacteria bacterium]|nr:hypothetical protein [Candidatus Poribacteria bacterium]